jgi:putative MATE family efflux protein
LNAATSDPSRSQQPERHRDSFWSVAVHALRGDDPGRDYTSEPLHRAVLLLAIPNALEMLLTSLFYLVDTFWVSRLGRDAIAAVALTESVMFIIYGVSWGLSLVATAAVARRIGEKQPEHATHMAAQILVLGVILSSALGLILSSFASEILQLMGADASVVTVGANFARVMFGFNLTVFLVSLLNAILRGMGRAVVAMHTMLLANALNLVIAPCLIFGWGPFPLLGVTGAAVSVNMSRCIGALYQLWHLVSSGSELSLRLHHLIPVFGMFRAIAVTAYGGIAQPLIGAISSIGLFKILAPYGIDAVAGYAIAIRLTSFALVPASGLANASTTLVGQNLGAGRPDRAEASVRVAMRFSVGFLGAFGIVFAILALPLVRLFTAKPDVIKHGTHALWILSLSFPAQAAMACLAAAFYGSGDTSTPTRLNFFCLLLGRVPLAWALSDALGFGPIGVYIAEPVSYSALALWSAFRFRQGRWKQQKI